MRDSAEQLQNTVEMALFDQAQKTGEELRNFIIAMNSTIHSSVPPDECELIARRIEEKDGVRGGLGAIIDSGEFGPVAL